MAASGVWCTRAAGPLGDLQAPLGRPPGATEILLVRHGSSDYTAVPDRAPVEDPPLSPAGFAQADTVADRLRHIDIGGLFVSPLQRTHQTARPLAAALGRRPQVVPELREVSLGDLEGAEFERRAAAGDPLVTEVWSRQRWDVIPGAEPAEDFAARVARGLHRVLELTGPDATAVAVVHGGVIAETCHRITGSQPFAFVDVENGSITRLLHTSDGRWRLRSFNDTAHLPGP